MSLPLSAEGVSQPPPLPSLTWEQLANSAQDRPAIILGKGPSLDLWLQSPSLPVSAAGVSESSPIIIGINHAAQLTPCHFGVTTHPENVEYADIPTQWLVSLPYPRTMADSHWIKPAYAAHWFLHTHGLQLLEQTREQIADLHSLWNQSCSAHPALHFAWYLGCTSVLFVGLDGTTTYAQAVAQTKTKPVKGGGLQYAGNRADTETGARILFGDRWSHWGPP